MNDINFNGENIEIGQFAEMLLLSAGSDQGLSELNQYSNTIASLDENTACQLRIAMQGIAMIGGVDPNLETAVTDYLENIQNGVSRSTCDLPEISQNHADLSFNGMKL